MNIGELPSKDFWVEKARAQFNQFAALSEDGILDANEAGQLVGRLIEEALERPMALASLLPAAVKALEEAKGLFFNAGGSGGYLQGLLKNDEVGRSRAESISEKCIQGFEAVTDALKRIAEVNQVVEKGNE